MGTAVMPATSGFSVTPDGEVVPSFDLAKFVALVSSPGYVEGQQKLAVAYDAAVKALIGPNDLQREGDREFKKKSAWRKLGRHFSISTRIVRERIELLDDGTKVATCVVEAKAPWGQTAEAVGACASDEEKGNRVITVSDMKATAETRATNRAVSNLIAMGEVSAEEMSKGSRAPRSEPAAGASATEKAAYADKGPKMPFGPLKNQHIGEIDESKVISGLEWADSKNAFQDFVKVARKWLDDRRTAKANAAEAMLAGGAAAGSGGAQAATNGAGAPSAPSSAPAATGGPSDEIPLPEEPGDADDDLPF